MKTKIQFLIIFIFVIFIPTVSFASNVVLENVSLKDKDTTNDTYDIKFDISWDNSWRIDGAPSPTANWDAIWLFVKYSAYSDDSWSDWGHCNLLNTGNVVPAGSQMDFVATSGVYKGIFIYRSATGSGSVDYNNAEIRWDYGADGISDTAAIKVRVFAIEMVYVPEGEFWIGDGSDKSSGSVGHFFDAGDSASSPDPIKIDSTAPYISDVDDGTGTSGDISWVAGNYTGKLPNTRTQLGANYPTGYDAFYIMKYEISQGQYRDFLNTLTRDQQNNRTRVQIADRYVMNNYFSFTHRNSIRAPSSIPEEAITFGCDANENKVFNEPTDGEWIVCNYLKWADIAAYADWTALRPLTELEFEKACRGPALVVDSEYAWGSTALTLAETIVNAEQSNEGVSESGDGLCNYFKNYEAEELRCGFAATAGTNRVQSGAGYYGAMNLSGNKWEPVVCVMDSRQGTTLSTFAGTHGDGVLSSTGFATNTDWPDEDAQGSGVRGGDVESTEKFLRVSDRYYAAAAKAKGNKGGRCASTAP